MLKTFIPNQDLVKELQLCLSVFNLMINDPMVPADHKQYMRLRADKAKELLYEKEDANV